MRGKGKTAMLMLAASCFFIFLLSRQAVAENRTQVFGNTVFTGESFKAGEDIYLIRVDDYEQVILEYSTSFMVVQNGTCQKKPYYQFCVNDIVYDTEKKEKKAEVEVYYYGPSITPTLSMNNSGMIVGEQGTVTLRLKNEGGYKASNVTVMYYFPSDIHLTKIVTKDEIIRNKTITAVNKQTGESQTLSGIFWQGEIPLDRIVTLAFNIRPMKPVKSSFSPTIIYSDGEKEIKKDKEVVTITTADYFEIKTGFFDEEYTVSPGTGITSGEGKSKLEKGEELLYIVHFHNKDETNHTINVTRLDFYFSDGFEYVSNPLLRVYSNASDVNASHLAGRIVPDKVAERLYRWLGKVKRGDMIFVFKLRGVREGKHYAFVDGEMTRGDNPLVQRYNNKDELEIELDEPRILIS